MVLGYPVIKAEGIIFRELFYSDAYVIDNGSVIIGTPQVNQGIILNSTTDAVNINTLYAKSNIKNSTVGTISAFVTTDNIAKTVQEIVGFGDTDADTRIQFDIYSNGKLRALAGIAGVTQWALETDTAVFADNVGASVVLVQDGTSPVLYVNGIAVAQTFTTSTDKTCWFKVMPGLDNARIGCGNWNAAGNAHFFSGYISEVSIYSRALSEKEVINNFQKNTFLELDANNHILYLPLRNNYLDGVKQKTNNLGLLDDPIWGDGSTTTTFPTLLPNNGVSFDGGDYIRLSPLMLVNDLPYQFSCLFRTTNTGTIILLDARDGSLYGISVYMSSGNISLLSTGSGGSGSTTTTVKYNDGQWHSLVAVIARSGAQHTYKIYIDGVLASSNTSSNLFTNTTATPTIGYLSSLIPGNGFVGSMKFVSLGQQEITLTQAKYLNDKLFGELNL